jgi:hypothetical protein
VIEHVAYLHSLVVPVIANVVADQSASLERRQKGNAEDVSTHSQGANDEASAVCTSGAEWDIAHPLNATD